MAKNSNYKKQHLLSYRINVWPMSWINCTLIIVQLLLRDTHWIHVVLFLDIFRGTSKVDRFSLLGCLNRNHKFYFHKVLDVKIWVKIPASLFFHPITSLISHLRWHAKLDHNDVCCLFI